jgi:O-succinylbenzoate synthase
VETSIGLAAGLALAGALPSLDFACGLGTRSLLTGDVTSETLSPLDGYLTVPRSVPEPDLAGGFAADNLTRTAWLARLTRVRALL